MRPINLKLRRTMANNDWYGRCCRCGARPVQWHHANLLGNKQIDEEWAIVPACLSCHKMVDTNKEVKHYFEWIAVTRMIATDRLNHPKWDWLAMKRRLDKQFLKPVFPY